MAKENLKKEVKKEEQENALSTAGQWIISHQNLLYGILIAILVLVFGYILIGKYVIEPKKNQAGDENAKAETLFMQGDWQQALNGDSIDCTGFDAIADQYSHFQEGELASLYAGICSYKMGEYDQAIEYLKEFSADDALVDAGAKQLLGDAYAQTGDYEKAVKSYGAAAKSESDLIAPMSLMKAGQIYLHELDAKDKALKCFEQIRDDYPISREANGIEKFIELAK